jgi:putative solute:sodium symporter small subunit
LIDLSQTVWWRKTQQLAVTVLVALALAVSLALLLAVPLDRGTFFNQPFGDFVVGTAAPVALALAIFWFADRQRVLDDHHDVDD